MLGRRDGLLALAITGGVIAAVVVVGPVWKDEVGPLYIDDPSAVAGEVSTGDELPERPPLETDPVRILPPVVATTTGVHEFLTMSGGRPVAYDPCRPIHYVVNPEGAPAGGDELIRGAVASISAVTGLSFVFDGVTDLRPSIDDDSETGSGSTAEYQPVVVTWSTEAEIPELAGDTAGVAGSAWVEMDRTGSARYVSGDVILDREDFDEILRERRGRSITRSIVLHEFGHLVGLDHVDDPDELMYESASDAVTDFGPGDLQGLAILGSGPCFSTS